MLQKNPFEFKSPDDINPNDVIDLFVRVFGEYYSVPEVGHTFINGPRGSGKSMMFRYMRPDCQQLVDHTGEKLEQARPIEHLDYLGIYLPIKRGQLDRTDIRIVENRHGEALLNEHFMVLHFSALTFYALSKIDFSNTEENQKLLVQFYNNILREHLYYSGCDKSQAPEFPNISSLSSGFLFIESLFKKLLKDFQTGYLWKLSGTNETIPYNGPIFLFTEFFFIILRELKRLAFMPAEKPIFLLIDDADNLNHIQKKILNSWVALRTSSDISLKISTQLKYKTFSTINDSRIDTPHDYSEVNLIDIYTTKKGVYLNRVKEMVKRRLDKYGFGSITPEEFFPEDKEQETAIQKKFAEYEVRKPGKAGYDFAYRYARPDYMKELSNRYTYSYAGFKQLVNISSGIMREFITFSHVMYSHQAARKIGAPIKSIDPSIQDEVIKEYSNNIFHSSLDALINDPENSKTEMSMLKNLIEAMGSAFREMLYNGAKERRVFSLALNDEPDDELKKILDIGVQFGYLQKSLIGNKTGTGKSRLYILTRLLAPCFQLDPSSFAAYKFVDSVELKLALTNPKDFVTIIKRDIKSSVKESGPDLFDNQSEENEQA